MVMHGSVYKKPYRKNKMSVAKKANAAYHMARKLKDQVGGIEYKHVDLISAFAPDNDGDLVILNSIAQGDSDNTRDGDKIKMQNLTIRFDVIGNAVTPDLVRLIIFHDKQNVIATVADYLQGVSEISSVLQPKNYDQRFRSKTLYDRTFTVSPDGPRIRHVTKVIKLNISTQYQGGTTTALTGSLKFIVLAIPAVAVSAFNMVSRLTYTDN